MTTVVAQSESSTSEALALLSNAALSILNGKGTAATTGKPPPDDLATNERPTKRLRFAAKSSGEAKLQEDLQDAPVSQQQPSGSREATVLHMDATPQPRTVGASLPPASSTEVTAHTRMKDVLGG